MKCAFSQKDNEGDYICFKIGKVDVSTRNGRWLKCLGNDKDRKNCPYWIGEKK